MPSETESMHGSRFSRFIIQACFWLVLAFSQFVWKMCGLHGVSSTFTATRISTVIKMSRLRARAWMLSTSGAGVQEEGAHREESTAWFARAVQEFPQDSEALTAAGEGLLEYGR